MLRFLRRANPASRHHALIDESMMAFWRGWTCKEGQGKPTSGIRLSFAFWTFSGYFLIDRRAMEFAE